MASTIERHHFLCTRWLLPARARDGVKENGTTKRIQACDTSAFTLIVSLETSYNFRIISKYFYKDFKGCLWHRTIEYRITCACDEINLQLLWTLAHTHKDWIKVGLRIGSQYNFIEHDNSWPLFIAISICFG